MPIPPLTGTVPAPDITPPTAPGTPVISNALASETVTVTVTASTDAAGVTGYAAFLDGNVNEAGRSTTTAINLAHVPAGTHSAVVRAFDAAGNYSAGSTATGFVIPAAPAASPVDINAYPNLAAAIAAGASDFKIGTQLYIGGMAVNNIQRTTPVKVATFGDSTASCHSASTTVSGSGNLNRANGLNSASDLTVVSTTTANWQSNVFGLTTTQFRCPDKFKFTLSDYYPLAYLIFNGGISGESTTQMLARDTSASALFKDRSTTSLIQAAPDVVLLRAGSINDLTVNATQAAMDAAVATCYANHIAIIKRITSGGIYVIDSGIHGYSGVVNGADVADPAMARAALVTLNSMYAAYALTNKYVRFLSYTGLTTDAAGNFYPGYCDSSGKHILTQAQRIVGQEEAKILTSLFGASRAVRYAGTNVITNALFDLSTAGLATGFTTTGTGLANTKIEFINNKRYQTFEATLLGTAGTTVSQGCGFTLPFNPGTMGITAGDIYGIEYDLLIESVDGINWPTLTGGQLRLDIRDSAGTTGRIYIECYIDDQTWYEVLTKNTYIHECTPPIVFGDISANLTTASVVGRNLTLTGPVGAVFKVGIAMPRLVKLNAQLNQPVLTL